MTLRLHGYAVSNYFNAAYGALIEKGAAFEIVPTRSAQDEAFLALSPMGKIPYLETPHGTLAETVAILEYIEDTVAGPALYPPDPFERAKARQLINVVQMYVEAPVRSLFAGVFMGGTKDPATVAAVRAMLDRSTAALRRLARPGPWLLGSFGHADIFAFYSLDIAERVTRFVYERPILAEAGLTEWHAAMLARPSTQTVLAAFAPAFATYLKDKNAAYREPAEPAPSPTREPTDA